MSAPHRHIRPLTLSSILIGSLALAGCAQVPSSELPDSCVPTTAFDVQREGGGSGPVVNGGGIASIRVTVDGPDGSALIPETSLRPDGTPGPVNVANLRDSGVGAVADALQCASSGQTITAQVPMQALFGDSGLPLTDTQKTQNATVHIDVDRVYHAAATGRIMPQQNGVPAVVTAPNGTPGVTMPNEDAPTQQRVATTIVGLGPKVQQGEQAVIQLSAFTWTNAQQIVSTWDQPAPLQVKVGDEQDGLFGSSAELVGLPVGSQRVVVLPAATVKADTPDGQVAPGGGDAIVLVMDILGIGGESK